MDLDNDLERIFLEIYLKLLLGNDCKFALSGYLCWR